MLLYGMHFGLEKSIFDEGKYVIDITEINPSQKYVTCTHSSNTNKLNCTLNSQNKHIRKVAPEL